MTITGGTTHATTYSYNTRGELGTVTDAATGEQWSKKYNLLGEVTSSTDPNSGTSTMSYDPDRNLTQLTDANNNPITYTYDALNRKTGEYDGTSTSAPLLASWVYDNSNNAVAGMLNPIGHLTTETSYSGGYAYTIQAQGFDPFGSSTGEKYTIPSGAPGVGALAGSYLVTHSYDTLVGQPYRDLYPASPGGVALPEESVTHLYGALDMPSGLDGSVLDPCKKSSGTCVDSYNYSVATMNEFSQPMDETLGSGTAYGNINYTYDPHTESLTDATVTLQGSGTPVDDTSYSYNPFGQITAQTGTRTTSSGTTQAETQCFDYDSLGRLTQAWTATDQCAAQPSANGGATVGDQIPMGAYWTSWKFDPLGDQTAQTQHSLTSAADTVTTYSYDGNGASQPNTLTSSATTGPGAATASYIYDADGNTLTRNLPSGKQTLTWTDDGKLASATAGGHTTSYIYDADGNLLLQKDPGLTTLYLFGGAQQFSLDTSTGTVTGTRFLPLPGGGMVVRTGTATNYSYELTDQHNTSLLTLDNTVAHPAWRQFTPYGAPRGKTPTAWPDTNGFLGAPTDASTSLTILGARQYDPTTARFLSTDPVTNLNAPQQTNGYTYATDNPINSDDPSGLCPSTACGGIPQPGPQNHRQPATNYAPCGIYSPCYYWPQAGQLKYMQSLGYVGSPAATPVEIAKWLQQSSHSITNPNTGWDYFCQGLAGRAQSQCGANPYNGDKNIYGNPFALSGSVGLCGSFLGGIGTELGGSGCLVLAVNFHTHTLQLGATATGGIGTGVPSAAAGISVFASNARYINQLSGPFADVGASVGQGAIGGGDISTGVDSNNREITMVSGSLMAGAVLSDVPELGWEIHALYTDTYTGTFFNWHF